MPQWLRGVRCLVAALAAAAGVLCAPPIVSASVVDTREAGARYSLQAAAQAPAAAASDDDTTIRAFLLTLENITRAGDRDAFVALEGPLGSAEEARAFADQELRPGATRVVIQERDRTEVTLSGIPGSGYSLTVDTFIEFGNQSRITTWQLFVRRAGDSWGLVRQEVVSSVDNLFRLSLNTARQYDARHLVITSEDLELAVDDAIVFTIDIDSGVTGLVVIGRGDMRFFPAPDTEKGQVRIFSGSEVLQTRFDALFVRLGTPEIHFDKTQLVARAVVDPKDLKRAQQIFREESAKSFAVDLADLTRDAWTLLPGPDDFLSEVRTRRFGTLTYARSASEPEDITVFERRRHRNIALYASKEKLQDRGRFYNEDDLAPFDVLDYDIDVTALPDRSWIDGRARMRVRVRSATLGQLTLRLADSLVVRSIVSDRFGRMFNLRVSNQNTVLVNLPSLLLKDSELTLTVVYSGRLEPQSPDRETLSLAQGGDDRPVELPQEITAVRAEPSYLYSNRSYWYPQSTVSDYATARIRLTVPIEYGCIASGEPLGEPEVITRKAGFDVQHVYVFRADRPARYLSFVLSRFVRTQRMTVTFPVEPPAAPLVKEAGPTESASAGAPIPALDLIIDANPRATRGNKDLAARTADIMSFYRSIVGELPYPGFTLALVENALPGGHSPPYFAELNQPLPNSPFTWRNDPAVFDNYPEFFVAHEIAHQWWGHGVGWQNYHEQWISEGFAQYFAAMYASKFRGEEIFQGVLRRMRRTAIDQSSQGPVYLGYRVGHIKNDGRAFRAIIYNKSAMALHMLRLLVGDETFFKGIRRFYTNSRFKKVGTEDFRAAMEAETGRPLQRFFERWIYNATLPQISFSYRVESGGPASRAVLRFDQSGDIFDIPALVTLEYADGHTKDVLVRVEDRTVEVPVPLDGALKAAFISKKDVSLAEYH